MTGSNSSEGVGLGRIFILAGIILLSAGCLVYGQDGAEDVAVMDRATIKEVVDSVTAAFNKHYLYPDTAKAMERFIRKQYKDHKYDGIKNLEELAGQLTQDLREVSSDGHVNIFLLSPNNFNPEIGDTRSDEVKAFIASKNYSFKKVEWLPGNVGYLRLDNFSDTRYAGETAVAAMNFLGNCDAIIIDLRFNHGGHEKMVRLLASYFFREPVYINNLYFTETDSLEQSWTDSYVPGKRPVDADLYILTSGSTASGAEAFSYGMKNLGRAKIVGETTAGAAHWVEYYNFPNLTIQAKIPIARPINPVTKTSWERVGVKPDIEVPYYEAFGVAYREALTKLTDKCTDDRERKNLEWQVVSAEAMINPFALSTDDMAQYTGLFDDGKYGIHIKDGRLFWRYSDGTDYGLVPLTADLFEFDDGDDPRIQIIRDENGKVTGFQAIYKSGESGKIHNRTGDI